MNALRRAATLASCVGLVLALAGTSAAQSTTGTIFGTVVDSSGAVLPGATITATNTLTSASKTAVTDGRGQFVLTYLTVGRYDISIEIPGFKTRTETGIRVGSGDELTVRYVMDIGAQTEQVTVVSEPALINMSSAEQDIRVDEAMVAEMPVQRRDISALLNNGPGASTGGGAISLNGLPPQGFTFSVDGVDASPDSEFPSLALYQNFNFIKGISMEAVKEVEVSKNIFSAEIGMTVSGNVNVISKSGTNEFHGSVFEYYNSGGLNARNHFTGGKVSTVFHQFGGSLGGPIVEDKVFFFGAYEGYRLTEQEPQSGNVPANEIREATLAAIPGSQAYWDLFPSPTGPSPDGLEAPFLGAFQKLQDDNHFVGRLDFNVSDSDYLTVRYTRGRPNFLDPRIAPGNSRDRVGSIENFGVSYTRVLNSSTTTELKFGFNKNETQRVDLIVPAGAVTINVPGVPDTSGELFIKNGTNFSVENNWATILGSHSVKFGAMGRFWEGSRINVEQPQYNFSSVPDLLANNPDVAAFQFGLEEFELTSFDMGLFVQDDWRASSDLMLNLGVRWDYSGVPQERDGRFYNRDGPFGGAESANPGTVVYRPVDSVYDAYYGMISPRLGFAYTLNEKTVIRGGAGIFFIPFNLFSGPVEIVQNRLGQPVEADLDREQLAALGIAYPDSNEVARPLVTSDCDESGEFPTCPQLGGAISDSSMDVGKTNPFSTQWNLAVSRQLSNTLALDVGYVGNIGHGLSYSPQYNQRPRDSVVQPVPGFGTPRHYTQDDESTYHALQTSLRKRFQDGFGFGIHYTYAMNLSYFRGQFTCCGAGDQPHINNNLAFGTNDDPTNPIYGSKGPPSFFNRHRLFANVMWEPPLGDSVLGSGWRLSLLLDLRSGNPLTIEDNASSRPPDRPDFLGSVPADAVNSGWRDGGTPYQYLNPNMFARVPINPDTRVQVRPGTMGRNSVFGPGYATMDVTVTKDFRFGPRTLQLRADIFNALNQTNFNNPQDNISSSSFGLITSQAGTGRSVQLAVRFIF